MASIIDLRSGLERENLETALRLHESEDFSTLIINSSVDGILTYDRELRYTLWNPAMEEISGIKSENVLGKHMLELFPFLRDSGLEKVFSEVLSGKTVIVDNLAFEIQQTGRKGITQNHHCPLKNELGEIVGGLAVVRNITETKQLIDGLRAENARLAARVKELSEALAPQSSRKP